MQAEVNDANKMRLRSFEKPTLRKKELSFQCCVNEYILPIMDSVNHKTTGCGIGRQNRSAPTSRLQGLQRIGLWPSLLLLETLPQDPATRGSILSVALANLCRTPPPKEICFIFGVSVILEYQAWRRNQVLCWIRQIQNMACVMTELKQTSRLLVFCCDRSIKALLQCHVLSPCDKWALLIEIKQVALLFLCTWCSFQYYVSLLNHALCPACGTLTHNWSLVVAFIFTGVYLFLSLSSSHSDLD